MTNAYKLMLGIFKQDPTTGSAYSALKDADYKALKWAFSSSIIPGDYDFTNFNRAGQTVETVQRNLITDLGKTVKFDSGAVTPSTLTFANMSPAGIKSVISSLSDLTGVDDPFKVLFAAGVYASTSTSTRTYNVIYSTVAIVTTDGALTAEAKAPFTGSLELQASGQPLETATDCAATMTFSETTGAVAFVPTTSGGL